MPKISVIVPIYNAEKYLCRCLESLRNATNVDLEILLIDDGSTDNSATICKKFCEEDRRFKYFYQKNLGVSAARNFGIKNAIGEYLSFCDGDDWIEADEYEFLYELLQKEDCDVAVCGYYQDTEDGSVSQCNGEYIVADSEQALALTLRDNTYGGYLWNKLFRRSIVGDRILREEIHVCEDLLFVCELLDEGNRFVFHNQPKYHYFANPDSVCRGTFNERLWSIQKAYCEIVALTDKKYRGVLAYAQAATTLANLSLAHRCEKAGGLNKTNYLRIKRELKKVVNKESKRRLRRIEGKRTTLPLVLFIFLHSRILFCALKKILRKLKKTLRRLRK